MNMEKDKIIKELAESQDRMSKYKNIELEDAIAITDALIYIVSMLDREAAIDGPVAAVKDPVKKSKKVDYGKIVALYQAGWSQKKIGEEMGVSANSICISLKRYKERLEEGFVWDPEERKFIKKV